MNLTRLYLMAFSLAFLLSVIMVTFFMKLLFDSQSEIEHTAVEIDELNNSRLAFIFMLLLQLTLGMSVPHYFIVIIHHCRKHTMTQ